MGTPMDQLTVDDYDMQWGTNVLGEFQDASSEVHPCP